ncbi:hypothetical protein LINGRAHAP2_LOCUS13647 [Linum grandiflorum]
MKKKISSIMSTKSAIFILFCCSCLLLNLVLTAHGLDQQPKGSGTGTGTGAGVGAPTYLDRIKAAATWAQTRFFPPRLNYATNKGADKMMNGAEEEGAATGGGKVKEAVAKSIEKGKETLESTAKSAARMATQTAHEAKEKVKKTYSDMKTTEVQVSDYEDDDEL